MVSRHQFDDGFVNRAMSRLQGKCVSDLVFIEVFAGTGRLTASVRRLGMNQSVGIDHIIHKQVRAPMVKLDLTKASDFNLLMNMLDDEDVAWVHCGRTTGWSGRFIRRFTRAVAVSQLPLHGDESDYGALLSAWYFFAAVLLHCQYGGERKKTTRLVHSIPEFQHLESFCDGSHEHQPWGLQHGVWTTSLETAYPLELCKSMADYFRRQLLFLGVTDVPSSLGDSNAGSATHLAQASVGKQPRGKKLPPLVSEFRQIIELISGVAAGCELSDQNFA